MATFDSLTYEPRTKFPPEFQDPPNVNMSLMSAYAEFTGDLAVGDDVNLFELKVGTILREVTFDADNLGNTPDIRLGDATSEARFLTVENLGDTGRTFLTTKNPVRKGGEVIKLKFVGANPPANMVIRVHLKYVMPV